MRGKLIRGVCLLLGVSTIHLFALDLSKATVIAPDDLRGPERKAIEMLVDEVAARTQGLRWTVAASGKNPAVRIQRGSGPAEGYSIRTDTTGITISGNDARGVLFGIGHLLRSLEYSRRKVELPAALNVTTAPKYPLRGHQLGYRPKTNSYDAWTPAMWEQYIRDLAIFGTNAIELIPPRSDDDDDSPHFPLPPMQMMTEMSRIADSYGLDVWVWYPAMDKDYGDPKTVDSALKEWEEVFRKLPRIDAVFVPGGDPGHTQPKHLMALLEKQTAVLRKHHPKATMWVSPQSFSADWMEEFFGILKKEPAWLAGVVFGPQQRTSVQELRKRVPMRYGIRFYPDITHSLRSQYPVPDWDVAYALTLQREPINPRPIDEAQIFRLLQPAQQAGFLTYSEGCNDDVNKLVWSGLGWNPDASVVEVLRQYSRYFIGGDLTEPFAQGLLALERNWRGPLKSNTGVDTTLAQFRAMEAKATPAQKLNWRFQQALYRAYYDAYVRARLLAETAQEEKAMAALRDAKRTGVEQALAAAESAMQPHSVAGDLRARVFELAEALFQSIRMQLSVDKYQAIAVGRGANLDLVDHPLNDAPWLRDRFAKIRGLQNEAAKLQAIHEIVNWTNPGPGGFYDDLGDPLNQPHLVREVTFDKDPAYLHGAMTSFTSRPPFTPLRTSWWTEAQTLNDEPMEMQYRDLDRTAQYLVRIVYSGDNTPVPVRLSANDKFEIHPMQPKPTDFQPVEFDIPREATAGGELKLRWTKPAGLGGNGRGVQVAEVWLIRK
jgi:hypothetical protein